MRHHRDRRRAADHAEPRPEDPLPTAHAINAGVVAVAYAVRRSLAQARTAAFATLAFCQLVFSFACRQAVYVAAARVLSNPWLYAAAIGVCRTAAGVY